MIQGLLNPLAHSSCFFSKNLLQVLFVIIICFPLNLDSLRSQQLAKHLVPTGRSCSSFQRWDGINQSPSNTITKCKAPAPVAPGPADQIYNPQGNLSQLFFTVSLFLGLKDFQSLLTTANMHNYPKHPKWQWITLAALSHTTNLHLTCTA